MKKLTFVLICLSSVIPCQANQADLNNNGKVDFVDFSVFAQAWRTQPGDFTWNPACDISEPNDNVIDEYDLLVLCNNWLWSSSQILLEIYSDGWGNLLETVTIEEEGPITILVYEEDPYYSPPAYYVYASRDGNYTEIYNCEASGSPPNNFITLDVDLDATVPEQFNGVIFITQSFFSDYCLSDTPVTVKQGDTIITVLQTDQQGKFNTELAPGNYVFEFTWWQEDYLEPVSISGQYQDFFFPDHYQAFKPNIYIYPEETTELDVDIVFPHGGRITTSVPDYNDGWHITVEPSGKIDGQFEYLFYESLQPDYGQYATGWVVMREELEDFFRSNMAQTGFNETEIDDFIEYWIPRLTDYPYYAIYPQYNNELNNMLKLEFSTEPANLIRLIYSVRGLQEDNLNIEPPAIPPFDREGFTVAEWGVILK